MEEKHYFIQVPVLSHTAGIEDSFLGAQTKVGVGKLKSLKEFFEQRPPRIIYEPSGQHVIPRDKHKRPGIDSDLPVDRHEMH